MSRSRDAVRGLFVADAAAMGLHWLYDPARIEALAADGPLAFRAPDRAAYDGVRGYLAHDGRAAGDPSQYGEVAETLLGHLAAAGGRFDRAGYQLAYRARFGPGGAYVGYADRPMRLTIARLLTAERPEDLPERSGADDDQAPALIAVAPLVAAGADAASLERAVRVTNDEDTAVDGAMVLAAALRGAIAGEPMEAALGAAVSRAGPRLRPLLEAALALPALDPIRAADRFGRPCHMHQVLPLALHIALRAPDLATAVEANVAAGGDSCGRAMALGPLAAATHGVPDALWARLTRRPALDRALAALAQ